MTPEEKIIEKVRKTLAADSVITNYTKSRIYASHISSIEEPKYPAISIHLLLSRPIFANSDMVSVSLQIDSWLLSKDYDMSDVMTIQRRIRALLHRQNLIDSTLSLKVAQLVEANSGPFIYEEDTMLYHYPTEYSAVVA